MPLGLGAGVEEGGRLGDDVGDGGGNIATVVEHFADPVELGGEVVGWFEHLHAAIDEARGDILAPEFRAYFDHFNEYYIPFPQSYHSDPYRKNFQNMESQECEINIRES